MDMNSVLMAMTNFFKKLVIAIILKPQILDK